MEELMNTEAPADNDRTEYDIIESTWELLEDVQDDLLEKDKISIPIAELSTLGAGVSSLLPAFRTVTQTMSIDTNGLYRLANAELGDTLKKASDGNYWGAFFTADKKSKFAKLKEVKELSVSNTAVMPVNPATIMMAAALLSIEKQLSEIAAMEREIISFLETEKQSEIEADIKTLSGIITHYKLNWDNEHYVSGHHKLVLDIKRTARKNMLFYQKKVRGVLASKQLVTVGPMIEETLKNLKKKHEYYRLSLYAFSMASFLEIMLSGNFKEENINQVRQEIEDLSLEYRNIFMQCSKYLEKMNKVSIDKNIAKGAGTASRTVGAFINSIPIIKEGPVDELLWDVGTSVKKSAYKADRAVLTSFGRLGDPGTGVYLQKMRDMVRIFNRTSEIVFDGQQIHLVAS